jgi:hypothetical protein
MAEFVKTREINDGGKRGSWVTALALYQPLAITPYQSQQTVLHTKADLLPMLVGDWVSSSEIPVERRATKWKKPAQIVHFNPLETNYAKVA